MNVVLLVVAVIRCFSKTSVNLEDTSYKMTDFYLFEPWSSYFFLHAPMLFYSFLMLSTISSIIFTCGGKRRDPTRGNDEEKEKMEESSTSTRSSPQSFVDSPISPMRAVVEVASEKETKEDIFTPSKLTSAKQISAMGTMKRGSSIFWFWNGLQKKQVHEASHCMPINKTMSMNDVERRNWKDGITELNAQRLLNRKSTDEKGRQPPVSAQETRKQRPLTNLISNQLNANWII